MKTQPQTRPVELIFSAPHSTIRSALNLACRDTVRYPGRPAGRPVRRFKRLWPFLALACCLFLALPGASLAEDEVIPPSLPPKAAEESRGGTLNTGLSFFDEADIGGGLYYFQRKRDRYDVEKGEWGKNLDHATVQGAAHFDSGWTGEGLQVGLDAGFYGSKDLRNQGAPDHEMNFVPWRSPWRPDWDSSTSDGFSLYKANLKMQAGPEDLRGWLRAGYLQPSGPGVLGVNWSLLPGTYQGVEAGMNFGSLESGETAGSAPGRLEVASMLVNAYKAPWYKHFYTLRKRDGHTRIDYLWSLGARYSLRPGPAEAAPLLTLEAAYGQADDYLKNFHFKAGYGLDLSRGRLDLKYNFYGMLDNDDTGSINDNFDGLAQQHYLGAFYSLGLWNFRAEYTYTLAPQSNDSHLGYFAYRLTNPTGSSKGAYDVWWDARSDWNHNREMAAFLGVSRGLDDLLPRGLTLGMGGAVGWDGRARGYSTHLKEYAWTADLVYLRHEGPLKGASVSLHYTRYYNRTDFPSWSPYGNAFQDEEDIKFLVSVPF